MVDSISDQPLPSPEAEQNVFEDHIALIYETAEERLAAVTPLIKVGLEKGELCLYISNEENDRGIVEALKAENIDVDKAVGNGGLILTSKKEIYFKLGRFDPDWTIRVLNNIADLAKSYGFTAMRIMSEMTWTLEQVPGVERWPEYEAKMNALNPGISLRIICQYDRNAFPPEAMLAAIKTHPKVVSQGAVSKNNFYIPAERLLKGDYASIELERTLDSIRLSNHSEAELHNRDHLVEQMRQLVDSSSAARRSLEQALEDSRRRFNEFAERASDWAWEIDDKGTYTYSSPRIKDVLGLQPEEVLGRSPLDLVSQEEADRVSAILTKTMASRTPITALEKEMRHKDGHAVFLEMNGTPMFDREGNFMGYRGIDRDITGRKSAKLAIDESRRRAEESVAEVQTRDRRIQGLEEAIYQLRGAQAERDASVASIKETLKASQLELARAGEDLGRLHDALRAREEEAVLAKTSAEAKQIEVEKHRASLTLLQQNLMDKELEVCGLRTSLEQVQGQYQEKENALNEISSSYRVQALELIASRGTLSGIEESINRKDEELVTLRQQMGRMETELREAQQAFASKAGDLVQVQEKVRLLNEALENKEAELARTSSEVRGKDSLMVEMLASQGALQMTLAAQAREIGARKEEAFQAAEELARVKAELAAKEAALGASIALSEGVKADMVLRIEEAQQARTMLEGEKDRLAQRVQDRESQMVQQQAAMTKLSEELAAREEELTAARTQLAAREHDLAKQMAQAEQRSQELKLKEDEMAAETEGRINASKAQLEQLRLDIIAQEAVVFGLREALARRDAEVAAHSSVDRSAETTAALMKEENIRLRSMIDVLGSELCAAREALGSREAELRVKKEALSESNDRFQAIFEQAGAGIARVSLDGRLLEANDKFYDMLGYDARELVGKTFRDITHRDDLAESALMYQRLVSGGVSSVSSMKRYVRKMGSTVWANVTMSSVRDAQGNLRYIMSIIDDRTDQMLAELALKEREEKESEERYKNVIENAPEGVWVVDNEGKTTFVNQRVGAMLGYGPEEMIGQPASRFMNPQWRQQQENAPEGLGNEVHFTRRDGTDLWVIISSMPILDQEGQSKGAIGLVNDITSLKAKEALAESSRNASLKEAALLKAVLSGVAAPIAVIGSDGRITQANPALERMLGASGLEGRSSTEVFPSLDLTAPFTIKLDIGGAERELVAVPSSLGSGEGGTVLSFTEAVKNEASSHPHESLAHDLNDSLTVIMGSVSLAKEYVIPEGRMYSKLKQIESASVTARDLASRLMATAKVGTSGEGAATDPSAPLVKGKGKVLLMDDDESILEATGDLLRYLGYTVDVARDGEEALDMCKEAQAARQPFELAILDLEIGKGMGGKEAGQKLKADNPNLRMIVSSGYVTDPVMTSPASMGFAAAIPKPYAAEVLSRVVASVLGPRA